ncbi:META and DUF4377 domain-containing protein [Thalassotalea sp. G20_0]|uniref:META and DUF4377 domain-containing protein n=1 Tax=Thalassotalea sp. G20_0 TaxID=2821093 RepID=UPI001ADD117C|nr:META and DUF4377 domain-containing protein [Thalassotalea sp. G20_0]MBO9496496.1 META and DUF4377 domain-containing protein [Thalassotalea sp. G20_0]
MKIVQFGAVIMSVLLTACSTLPEGRWQEDSPAPITLDIKDDHIAAHAGCNRLMGSVKMHGDRLVVEQLASTLMMCHGEEAEKEEALKQLLGNKPRVQMSGDQLILSTNTSSYVFNKQPNMEDGVTRFIYVASEKTGCVGVGPMECLQIRESKEDPWTLFYGDIEGFEFTPGIAYRLRIKEFDVPNPPADASSKRWILDLVVEQEWVNNQ